MHVTRSELCALAESSNTRVVKLLTGAYDWGIQLRCACNVHAPVGWLRSMTRGADGVLAERARETLRQIGGMA